MKSFILLLLLGIATSSYASPDGTVHMQLSREEGFSSRNLHRRQDETTPDESEPSNTPQSFPEVELPNNEFFLGYYVNVTIGDPPQSFRMHIDTGSSDAWVISKDAQVTENPLLSFPGTDGGRFDPANIDQSTVHPDAFSIRYADNSTAIGDYFRDSLTIGGTTVNNFTIGLAKKAQSSRGILGISFPGFQSSNLQTVPEEKRFAYPTLAETMVTAGNIKSEAFSLWLNDIHASSGSLLFGGVDTEKFEGPLANIAMYKQNNSDLATINRFIVSFSSLTITTPSGSADITTSEFKPQQALLDSGASNTYLPDDIVQSIYKVTGAFWLKEYSAPAVPCTVRDVEGTFDIGFAGPNGPVIRVPISNMVYPAFVQGIQKNISETSDIPACVFGISPMSLVGNEMILGDTFLRSAYVVYDMHNKRVGMAQSKFNATKSNIIAFESEGADIPSATTVSDEATAAFTSLTSSTSFSPSPGDMFVGPVGEAFKSAYSDVPPEITAMNTPTSTSSTAGTATASSSDKPGAGSALTPFAWERVVLMGLTMVLVCGGALML